MKKTLIKFFLIIILTIICILTLITFIYVHQSFKNAKNIKIINNNYKESIWIYDKLDKRCLSMQNPLSVSSIIFGFTNMSCIYPKKNFVPVFDYCKMILSSLYLNFQPRKILMIGLGGGALVSTFSYIIPDIEIDIVEISKEILEISKKFFDFKENDKIRVYIADGVFHVLDLVKQQKKYDIIILDAFDQNYIPTDMLKINFMNNLKKILNYNGVIAINTFANSKTYAVESDLFFQAFGNFYNLIINNNRVILATKKDLPNIEHIKLGANKLDHKFKKLFINTEETLNNFKIFKK